MRFFKPAHLASLGLLALQSVAALSEYDYLAVVKDFADQFISPQNAQVAASINSTLFAEDVFGTVDVSTDFDGRELSTEYLFGLFVNNAKDGVSPLGTPISYNIDAYFRINEQRQITQYDASFRRWAWATDVIVPQLYPYMAEAMNVSDTNSTAVFQTYMANVVCQGAMTYCNGTNQQYDSYDDCMSFVTNKPIGQWYRLGEDNLLCRSLHTPMLPLRPSVHCPHVGPTGGDMCIPRDYKQVVLESHFPAGWLAPKYVTPENQASVSDIYATNGTSLNPLLQISMSADDLHSWDPTLYPIAIICYFLLYYIVAAALTFSLSRFNSVYAGLSLEHQKNVTIYIMNIFFTTVALALELCGAPALGGTYNLWGLQCLRTSGVIISSLYCFELVYRLSMRWPLIAHHFFTIFAISFTVAVFEYTQTMSYMVSAIIWLFQATTEQATFVGLLGYRLQWNPILVAWVLKFGAIQTFIVKSASAIALIAYWGVNQDYTYRSIDQAWTAMVWIIAVGLLMTQVWGSWITYAIGRRVARPPRERSDSKERFTAGESSSGSETPGSSRSSTMPAQV